MPEIALAHSQSAVQDKGTANDYCVSTSAIFVTFLILWEAFRAPFELSNWDDYFRERGFSLPLAPGSKWHSIAPIFLLAILLSTEVRILLTDGLCRPLTLVHTIQQLGLKPAPGGTPNFVYIIGASADVEEAQVCVLAAHRLLYMPDSSLQVCDDSLGARCWSEFASFFPGCMFGLVFIGPELSLEREGSVQFIGPTMFTTFVRSRFHEFLRDECALHGLNEKPLLVAAFNPGMGASLRTLLGSGHPCPSERPRLSSPSQQLDGVPSAVEADWPSEGQSIPADLLPPPEGQPGRPPQSYAPPEPIPGDSWGFTIAAAVFLNVPCVCTMVNDQDDLRLDLDYLKTRFAFIVHCIIL